MPALCWRYWSVLHLAVSSLAATQSRRSILRWRDEESRYATLLQEASMTTRTCPPMFVAVFSAQSNANQRASIREMWSSAAESWGQLQAKFILCSSPKPTTQMKMEAKTNGDMLFLDCKEGYRQGLLTNKVVTTMKRYLNMYGQYDLFMKVDDDTFVSARRLCFRFLWREDNNLRNTRIYAGVFMEGLNESMLTNHTPNRDPMSNFYEPYETFPGDIFPLSAKGGPGYILGKNLVQDIISNDIAANHLLNNEDKAVGVWVDQLRRQKIEVNIVNIPGTDGYAMHAGQTVRNGTYQKYPYFLHHHLPGETIECMHHVDKSLNPKTLIDDCFEKF
eukprot:TRINITY_DN4268_c0_g2_i1.p1 TRINITY_DN4268_c0_g2~~TRINITY_DN4268_c0_g2_i1.p1  ORF type:complete len:333 (+),score=44.84 TRINITY_DN4268_c0_g2_i1:125-1123(+)